MSLKLISFSSQARQEGKQNYQQDIKSPLVHMADTNLISLKGSSLTNPPPELARLIIIVFLGILLLLLTILTIASPILRKNNRLLDYICYSQERASGPSLHTIKSWNDTVLIFSHLNINYFCIGLVSKNKLFLNKICLNVNEYTVHIEVLLTIRNKQLLERVWVHFKK